MRLRVVASLLAAAVLFQAAAAYECPSEMCNASPTCMAASNVPPGNLAPSDVPQFIVLTNDDAITVVTQPIILNITERHTNKNGCKMPATWFLNVNFTDPTMVQQVYFRGHEVATHTVSHVANPNATQIVGAKLWLNETAKIPLEDIQGFRAPYLLFSPEQRKILNDNGFRWDSSISEQYGPSSPFSPNAANRLWPYTFDCGVAQDCSISTGTCEAGESYPGLWEFPLYASQAADGTVIGTMDPQGDMYEIYKREFDDRYNGNRAPLGIFIHAAWLIANPPNVDQINRFLEYAMTHDNVFLVTVQQVLNWMKNPVPASQYNPTCPSQAEIEAKVGNKLCVMPNAGCGYGTFNSASCQCDCQNELVNAGGYCRDADGVCSVQKDFDFNTKQYTCAPTPPKNDTGSQNGYNIGSSAGNGGSSTSALGDAKCGHPLLKYSGLSSSGLTDPSILYAQAMKAIDGACETCASLEAVNGQSYLEITLDGPFTMSGVLILTPGDTTVSIRAGNDSAAGGLLNPLCAEDVNVPGNTPTPVPCTATASRLIVSSASSMSLCDVYPISPNVPAMDPNAGSASSGSSGSASSGSAAPAPAAVPAVILQMDVAGTVDDFNSNGAKTLCETLIKMTGDPTATCEIQSVTQNEGRRRRLMQTNGVESVRVVVAIVTKNPEVVARAFSNGTMLSSLLRPATGLTVSPETIKAKVDETGGSSSGSSSGSGSSSSSDDSGSSVPVGAIVGGVIGGLVALALIVWLVIYIKRRKQEADDDKEFNEISGGGVLSETGRSASMLNPAYNPDATVLATVTTASPLKDSVKALMGPPADDL